MTTRPQFRIGVPIGVAGALVASRSVADAYQFVSRNSLASIIQAADPGYTMLVSIAKSQLPTRRA